MKQRLKSRCLLVFLGALYFGTLSAQESFRFNAEIGKVPADGFYRIRLEPALIAKAKSNLADIRIVDDHKSFVPYVSQVSLPETKATFSSLPILENQQTTDSTTSLLIQNKDRKLLQSIWLNLKNANVLRSADLSGSDDLKKWYAIEEGLILQNTFSESKDQHFQAIHFPSSNYRYFRLLINNKGKNPLNIIAAGDFSAYQKSSLFDKIPSLSWSIRDSADKCTYVKLNLIDNFKLDRLKLSVTEPKFYKRSIEIYELNTAGKIFLTSAELSSESQNEVSLTDKVKHYEIKVINGDNPPLKISNVEAWQLSSYIMAYLQKGKTYSILCGDSKAQTPDYDLHFFTDNALKNLTDIKHQSLTRNPMFKIPAVKTSKDFTYLLWTAMALAVILLSLLTRKMLNEMSLKNKSDVDNI